MVSCSNNSLAIEPSQEDQGYHHQQQQHHPADVVKQVVDEGMSSGEENISRTSATTIETNDDGIIIPLASASISRSSSRASFLRHDEQEDEDYYDKRDETLFKEDDCAKLDGKIKFSTKKLYGRDTELQTLHDIYNNRILKAAGMGGAGAAPAVVGTAQTVFLPGFSGTGKSALVKEFISQLTGSSSSTASDTTTIATAAKPRFISGKYDELSVESYSAIAKGIGAFINQLLENTQNCDDTQAQTELEILRYELHQTGLGQYASVLQDIVPEIMLLMEEQGQQNGGKGDLYDNDEQDSTSPPRDIMNNANSVTSATSSFDEGSSTHRLNKNTSSNGGSSSGTFNRRNRYRRNHTGSGSVSSFGDGNSKSTTATKKNQNQKVQLTMLKHVFRNLIKLLCSSQRPLIMFLDDLQWIDDGSMELLTSLLLNSSNDPQLQYFMFIGAYRSNEVSNKPDHKVSLLIRDLQQKQQQGGTNNNGDNAAAAASSSNSIVLELVELCQNDINEFIQDTLNFETPHESWPLTKAIYPRTLGNIFFTMQALEELVRKSVLYYDVMFFAWSFNITDAERMNNLLSSNVVEMVQSKIRHTLPYHVQRALCIFAYTTRSSIDVYTLYELFLAASSVPLNGNYNDDVQGDSDKKKNMTKTPNPTKVSSLSLKELIEGLDVAVNEGLLILAKDSAAAEENNDFNDYGGGSSNDEGRATHSAPNRVYVFSHDRIQEASSTLLIPDGDKSSEQHYELCYLIAGELEYRYSNTEYGEDWMLFTAVYHMNSLPPKYFSTSNSSSCPFYDDEAALYLGTINSKAADLAIQRSAFGQAVQLLRAGVNCFIERTPDESGEFHTSTKSETKKAPWEDHYDLCLSLYNRLIETEFTLGNMENAQQAVDTILQEAPIRNPQDKIIAQFHDIEIHTSNKGRDFVGACIKSIKYLVQDHGIEELSSCIVDAIAEPEAAAQKKTSPSDDGANKKAADSVPAAPASTSPPPQKKIEVTDRQLKQEKQSLEVVKRNQYYGDSRPSCCFPSRKSNKLSLMDLIELDIEMDEYHTLVMKLLAQLSHAAMVSGNTNLCLLVNSVAQKLSWMYGGLNEYLPTMLPHYGSQLRKLGKLQQAANVAISAEELFHKMMMNGSPASSFVRGMHVCRGAVIGMKVNFASNIDVCHEVYKTGMDCGETQFGIMAAMVYSLSYFCIGGPLNTLFESKLLQFQNEATANRLSPTLIVTFQVFRQALYNLQGKSGGNNNPNGVVAGDYYGGGGSGITNPTMFIDGTALDEDKKLAEFQPEGSPAYKQTLRDISIFRLLLGIVFKDKGCMIQMLDRLSNYPDFDLCVPRQHLRNVVMGMAAFYLARTFQKQLEQLKKELRNMKKNKNASTAFTTTNPEDATARLDELKQRIQSFEKIGQSKLDFFTNLKQKVQSENATPIVSAIHAVATASTSSSSSKIKKAYDKAIQVCTEEYDLPHLAAILNEWCGMLLLEKSKMVYNDSNMIQAQRYLTASMWLYYDWGAMAKVKLMRETYSFLHGVQRKERRKSSVMMMTMNNSGNTSDYNNNKSFVSRMSNGSVGGSVGELSFDSVIIEGGILTTTTTKTRRRRK